MHDAVFEHLVAAVEGMLGGLTHLQQTVPQAFGLGPVLTAARARMQEVRNLMAPPEPPAVQPEAPPKIEDIHGEIPPPPVPAGEIPASDGSPAAPLTGDESAPPAPDHS